MVLCSVSFVLEWCRDGKEDWMASQYRVAVLHMGDMWSVYSCIVGLTCMYLLAASTAVHTSLTCMVSLYFSASVSRELMQLSLSFTHHSQAQSRQPHNRFHSTKLRSPHTLITFFPLSPSQEKASALGSCAVWSQWHIVSQWSWHICIAVLNAINAASWVIKSSILTLTSHQMERVLLLEHDSNPCSHLDSDIQYLGKWEYFNHQDIEPSRYRAWT